MTKEEILQPFVIVGKIDGIPYDMVMKQDALSAMDEYTAALKWEAEYWKQKHDLTANSLLEEINILRSQTNSAN